jgi:hypothetical protein
LAAVEVTRLDGSFVRKHLTGQEELRPTVINWPNEVVRIVDEYRQHRGLVHGVQKDAIQNSWDARTDKKKGRGWSTLFELIKGKEADFFVFTDAGTTGLTGRVLSLEEMDRDLPEEERWGRFESLAFTKTLEQESAPLGSRGQGKFIFVGASKRYTILYDTFRKDGVYRLGVRWVEPTQSPVYSWEKEEARQKLSEMTGGVLQPLNAVGSRVIIVDPVNELVDAVKNGAFMHFVGETWWEIIDKYQAKIILRFDGHEIRAEKPKELEFPEKDSKECAVWLKENEKQKRGTISFFVKKLHIACNRKKTVPEDIRGIAIQRGGMKVCTISHRYLPQNLADNICGSITFDEDTERELRLLEGPTHYTFDFSRGVARAIREYVLEELEKFAKEKLGWGADVRQIKRAKQQEAEQQAIWAANRVASKIGLSGKAKKKTKRRGKEGRHWKTIRVRFAEFIFPHEDTIRVNWGEKLKDIIPEVTNDTDNKISVRAKVFTRFFDKVITNLLEKEVEVPPHRSIEVFGPHSEHIDKKAYPEKGKYFVVTKINSLMEENKGVELDETKQAFYVERDPPKRGLFEKCEWIGTNPEWMGTVERGEEEGWKLVYNVDHPSYRASEEKVEEQKEYFFRLLAFGMCKIDLETRKAKLIRDPEILEPAALAEQILEGLGKIMYHYHV